MNNEALNEINAKMPPLLVKKTTNADNSNIVTLSEEFTFELDNSLVDMDGIGVSAAFTTSLTIKVFL